MHVKEESAVPSNFQRRIGRFRGIKEVSIAKSRRAL